MPETRPKIYQYKTSIRWICERKGIPSSSGKPDIIFATPPEFGGHTGYWSPEDLLISSVQTCILTTFLAIIDKKGLKIMSYESHAIGDLQMADGVFRFSQIKVMPEIVLFSNTSVDEIKTAITIAEKRCLVSNSLITKVIVEPNIKYEF